MLSISPPIDVSTAPTSALSVSNHDAPKKSNSSTNSSGRIPPPTSHDRIASHSQDSFRRSATEPSSRPVSPLSLQIEPPHVLGPTPPKLTRFVSQTIEESRSPHSNIASALESRYSLDTNQPTYTRENQQAFIEQFQAQHPKNWFGRRTFNDASPEKLYAIFVFETIWAYSKNFTEIEARDKLVDLYHSSYEWTKQPEISKAQRIKVCNEAFELGKNIYAQVEFAEQSKEILSILSQDPAVGPTLAQLTEEERTNQQNRFSKALFNLKRCPDLVSSKNQLLGLQQVLELCQIGSSNKQSADTLLPIVIELLKSNLNSKLQKMLNVLAEQDSGLGLSAYTLTTFLSAHCIAAK